MTIRTQEAPKTLHESVLKSAHIVVTQTRGNTRLSSLIEKASGHVQSLPILEIQHQKISAMKQRACHEADTWIFLSQHSVTANAELLKQIQTDQSVIAIGPCTKACVEAQSLVVDAIPEADFSSIGITNLDYFNTTASKKILIFSEASKPKYLIQSLRDKGHEVCHMATYRHCPTPAETIIAKLQDLQSHVNYITTHSQKGLTHLMHCIEQGSLYAYHHKTLLVTCEKMAKTAKKFGFQTIIQSQNNTAEAIMSTLKQQHQGSAST